MKRYTLNFRLPTLGTPEAPSALTSLLFLRKAIVLLFCLYWVFVASHGLSLMASVGGGGAWGAYSTTSPFMGFSWQWLLLLQTQVLGCRLSSCDAWAQPPMLHVDASQTRSQAHFPWIGRQTPNHWFTREDPQLFFLNSDKGLLCSTPWVTSHDAVHR